MSQTPLLIDFIYTEQYDGSLITHVNIINNIWHTTL